jgi:hypothetical protein
LARRVVSTVSHLSCLAQTMSSRMLIHMPQYKSCQLQLLHILKRPRFLISRRYDRFPTSRQPLGQVLIVSPPQMLILPSRLLVLCSRGFPPTLQRMVADSPSITCQLHHNGSGTIKVPGRLIRFVMDKPSFCRSRGLSANSELPDYLSILSVNGNPPFTEDEFRFADERLDGLMLDSNGIQLLRQQTLCNPCSTYREQSRYPSTLLHLECRPVSPANKKCGSSDFRVDGQPIRPVLN